MRIETTKGNFDGTFEECAAWLEDMQPSHADLVIGHLAQSINPDADSWQRGGFCRPDADNWAKSLSVAGGGIGEQAADELLRLTLNPEEN